MDLSLEKLSKAELVQLILKEKSRTKNQEKQLQLNESTIQKNEVVIQKNESTIQKNEVVIQKNEIVIQKSEAEVKWLNHQIDQLKRMLFGAKSERFEASDVDSSQLSLFNDYASQEEKEDETPVKEIITYERKKHKGRNRIPEELPVVEYVIEPDEDVSEMKKIGEQRTEILEYTPEKFFKLVIIRPKYARLEWNQNLDLNNETKNVVIAGLPSRPIEKCLAGTSLLTAILVNKYVDHLPLYRQQQIFRRSDIEIAPSTIDSWVAQLGNLLSPLYDRLVDEIKAQNYLQADETTTKVLDKLKKHRTHLGYYWTYYAPMAKLVAFDYQRGRGNDAPRSFLEGFEGVLQTDGYIVYKHYYDNEKVTHLACWAHARRKFEKALDSDRKRASHVMSEIQKLYAIERSIKDFSTGKRKEVRLEQALPIINDLGKWLYIQRQQVLPKSLMGKAIEYISNLWDSLGNYLHDGNLQIDNNLIENSIRPIALGRKNYLFAGSHNGANRSAMFYSFFACCKLNGINPQKWLQYVLENIADHKANKLHDLLPNNIDPEKLSSFKRFWEV